MYIHTLLTLKKYTDIILHLFEVEICSLYLSESFLIWYSANLFSQSLPWAVLVYWDGISTAGCADDGAIAHQSEVIDQWHTPSIYWMIFQISHTLGAGREKGCFTFLEFKVKNVMVMCLYPSSRSRFNASHALILTTENNFCWVDKHSSWRSRFMHAFALAHCAIKLKLDSWITSVWRDRIRMATKLDDGLEKNVD